MSAEQLGRRLLEEVEEGNLDDLLREIRSLAGEKQASNLGIEGLDQIIELFRRPLRTPTRQPWTSPEASSDDEENYYDDPSQLFIREANASAQKTKLKPKVIQLTSSRSAAGKTSLLYHLSALSILPESHNGNETTIVWLDTDGRFSAYRLAQIATHIIPASAENADRDAITKEALSHVHVFRPQSAAQLIGTLKTLPDYLVSRTQHHSQHRALGLMVLDSATAFYWADRADAEVARLSDPVAPNSPSAASRIIAELREIEKLFKCAICFTTDSSLQRKSKSKSSTDTRTVADSPLPPQNEQIFQDPWTNFATLTLNLQRIPVPQFAPAMAVEKCVRDQPRRIEAVKIGRHRAQVVWTGQEQNDVREGVRRLQNGEGFNFRATGLGIDFE